MENMLYAVQLLTYADALRYFLIILRGVFKELDINQQVAEDAVEQYKIENQSGDHTKKCLHARTVADACLKTNDEARYQHWKLIGQSECRQ